MPKIVSQRVKSSILLLLIGYILCAVSSISFLSFALSGLGFLSICSLVGVILELIAIIRLKDEYQQFHKVFKGIVINLFLYLLGAILLSIISYTATNGLTPGAYVAFQIIGAASSAAALLLSIYITLNIIRGCISISDNNPEVIKFGKIATKWYFITIIAGAIAVILSSIFNSVLVYLIINDKPYDGLLIVYQIFSSIGFAIDIAAGVLMGIFLIKAYKSVETNN